MDLPFKKIRVLFLSSSEAQYFSIRSALSSVLDAEYLLEWENDPDKISRSRIEAGTYHIYLIDHTFERKESLAKIASIIAEAKLPALFISFDEEELNTYPPFVNEIFDTLPFGADNSLMLHKNISFLLDKQRILNELAENKEEFSNQLSLAQAKLNNLTGWQTGSITAQLSGIGPLSQRHPSEFKTLQLSYEAILEEYLESLSKNKKPQTEVINKLAWDIGDLGGGPRDVIDIHLKCVKGKSASFNPKRIMAYTVEGRLLVIELMGYLVDYYRLRL